MILLNDFKKQFSEIQQPMQKALQSVGESGWLVLGKEVQRFEDTIEGMIKSKAVVGCASGLDALEICLRVLGLRPGDKVLTTPLSAFATTLAILRLGGKPVFVDVDSNGLIDLELCEKALQNDAEIKFLLPVHLFGFALNLKKLAQLKQQHGIKIVEDCAQAILAQSEGVPIASVGDMSAFSLYPTKNLGCYGDGGFIATNNLEYAEKAKSLRDYGQSSKYEHTLIGLNSRLDELQAAFLNEAILPKLLEYTQRRREIANVYLEHINNKNINLPKIQNPNEAVWHLFPILSSARDELAQYLHENNIQTGVHYPKLITVQQAMKCYEYGFEMNSPLENAALYVNQELSLPIHPQLTNAEIKTVIDICNHWKS